MRPAIWVHADKVALSATGKTDEKLLLSKVAAAAAESSEYSFTITGDGEVVPIAEVQHV